MAESRQEQRESRTGLNCGLTECNKHGVDIRQTWHGFVLLKLELNTVHVKTREISLWILII